MMRTIALVVVNVYLFCKSNLKYEMYFTLSAGYIGK